MNEVWESNARVCLPVPLSVHFDGNPEHEGLVWNLSNQGMQIKGLVAGKGECRTIVILPNGHCEEELRLRAICKWSTNDDSRGQGCCGFTITNESIHDFSRLLEESFVSQKLKTVERDARTVSDGRSPCIKAEESVGGPEPFVSSGIRRTARFKTILKDNSFSRKLALYAVIIVDLIGIVFSIWIGYCVFPQFTGLSPGYSFPTEATVTIIVLFPIVSLILGLYERDIFTSWERLFLYSSIGAVFIWAIGLAYLYILSDPIPGRWVSGVGFLSLMGIFISVRILYRYLMIRFPLRLVFFGPNEEREFLKKNLEGRKLKDMKLLEGGPQNVFSREANKKEKSDGGGDARHGDFDWLIVSKEHYSRLSDLIMRCIVRGTRVDEFGNFIETAFLRTPLSAADIQWLVCAEKKLLWNMNRVIKAGIDTIVAAAALLLSSPMWVIIAILIKIEDNGPVFFKQTRVGRGGSHFQILKFRTMREDGEKHCSPQWAKKNDHRVTRIGRFLRRTRLDEMPQFLNVIRRDMSLIGPRPETVEYVAKLRESIPNYDLRHLVRPGISGWAQIKYRYVASMEDTKNKLSYDLYYIKHGSVFLDFYVLLRTLGVFARGAR